MHTISKVCLSVPFSLWLRTNESEASQKQKASQLRRDELERLKTKLCEKLCLTDIR